MLYISDSRVYRKALWGTQNVETVALARLKRGFEDSHILIVSILKNLTEFRRMWQVAHQALSLECENKGFFYYHAGLGAYQSGEYNEALRYLYEAAKFSPEDEEVYLYLSLSLKALNQTAMAEEFLKKAAALGQRKSPKPDLVQSVEPRVF